MSAAAPPLRDVALGFTLPDRHARGRVLRLGPALGQILAAHAYPAPLARLLAEAVVIAGLMGALLKAEGGQLTLQAQADGGVIDLLVADYRDGALRGYLRHDAARLADCGAEPSLAALLGQGTLAIIFDLGASGERYQGIVPLDAASLAGACEYYFAQSEQVPTIIRVGFTQGPAGPIAGGLLIQHLAEGEAGRERLHVRLDHPEWMHVAALAGSVRGTELVDPALPLDGLLWRLFHEERSLVGEAIALSRGCRCSAKHFRDVLARFPAAEHAEMRGPDGQVHVDCAFCARRFAIDL